MKNFTSYILLLLCVTLSMAQPLVDTTFRVTVEQPRFKQGSGPKVLVDEGHNNLHKKEGGLFVFTRMMESDGAVVESNVKKFSADILDGYDILVIVNALHDSNVGNWQNPCPSAFTEEEIFAVVNFVKNGGSLLFVADHMPYGGAAQDMGKAFGVEWSNGFAIQPGKNWPPSFFTRESGMVKDSPVTTEGEYLKTINGIASFTGSVFKVPERAKPFMVYDDSHAVLVPDVAWQFSENTKNFNSEGWVQGACLDYGKGRIVFLGEAAMITAQLRGKTRIGMNSPEAPENAQLALNIFRYLAAQKN